MGSGFAGIEVLKCLQRKFKNSETDITLVSKDNFFLFTPMLPEVFSGLIEIRHIVTPVRTFCKNARFYEADIKSIDLKNKNVIISTEIGRAFNPFSLDVHTLSYDYLIIALGSETNFFHMKDVEKYALKMKTIEDAIILRNHILNMLEQASIEQDNTELRKCLLTFVVVGGGFSGIETTGVLNDFIKETVKRFYKNISQDDISIILINGHDKILPEIAEELGEYALKKLKDNGVKFIMKTHVVEATANTVKLKDGYIIPTFTLIWTAGITPSNHDIIANLPCNHNKDGKIITNQYLQVPEYLDTYALGDCASIPDSHTGKDYPPTAQNAIEEGKLAAKNIVFSIKGKSNSKKEFRYKSKGMMAQIGRRSGVAQLFGYNFHGFVAWWLWRTFYLYNLPTTDKKLKVIGDWTADLFFKPDMTMIKNVPLNKKSD